MFWLVFLASQVEVNKVNMMKKPRTIANSWVSSFEKLKLTMIMFAKAPRPDVGRVVKSWIKAKHQARFEY